MIYCRRSSQISYLSSPSILSHVTWIDSQRLHTSQFNSTALLSASKCWSPLHHLQRQRTPSQMGGVPSYHQWPRQLDQRRYGQIAGSQLSAIAARDATHWKRPPTTQAWRNASQGAPEKPTEAFVQWTAGRWLMAINVTQLGRWVHILVRFRLTRPNSKHGVR